MRQSTTHSLALLLAAAGWAAADDRTVPATENPRPAVSLPVTGNARPIQAASPAKGGADRHALAARLVEALSDSDAVVVQHVGNALAGLGPKSVPALVGALSHPDKAVRGRAAEVLGRLGAAAQAGEALPALLKALKDKEVEVRRAAAFALSQLVNGGRGATPPPPIPTSAPAYTPTVPPACYGTPYSCPLPSPHYEPVL
jgi:hypothetical protein